MSVQATKFEPGTRVKLRDGIDSSFYLGMARTGMEGWITDYRHDRFDLPEAYIQWDTTHWAYNRQPDGWTFEDHFETVEDKHMTPESKPEPNRGFSSVMAEILQKHFPPRPPVNDKVESEEMMTLPGRGEKYMAAIDRAMEGMTESDAFVTVAIIRKDHPEAPAGEFQIVIAADSLTPEADILLGSQLSSLGAQMHREAALMHVQNLTQDDS